MADRFGAEYSDPMIECMRVKHINTMKVYQATFDSVMTRINLSVEHWSIPSVSFWTISSQSLVMQWVWKNHVVCLKLITSQDWRSQNLLLKVRKLEGQFQGQFHHHIEKLLTWVLVGHKEGTLVGSRNLLLKMDQFKRKRLTQTEMDEERFVFILWWKILTWS